MSHEPTQPLPAARDFASRVWNQLSQCVDDFINAWDEALEPPQLAPFVPAEAPDVRRLMLSELIKVDLEYRWRGMRFPKQLEEYLAEFPELADNGLAPVDLVYEEYHVRRQSGDSVKPQDYYQRFPAQETELRRMLKLETPRATTTLVGGSAKLPTGMTGKIDDFDLLTELGRGAFACVYLARQVSMQRMVALKISADKGSEAQTLAQLDHPNIVRVYDQRSLPDRKLRLIYMQYLAGGTLEAALHQIQQLPPTERRGLYYVKAVDKALDDRGESPPADSTMREKLSNASWPEVVCWLGSKLAAALTYAHSSGVLHRDLKPANVLVAADGNPKLADFNISFSNKVEGATPAAYFGGSLAYMSPEQLEACNPAHEREPDSLDGRSDVFSLGVMLWELLTGSRPFPDERPSGNWSAQLTTMVARRTAGIDPRTLSSLPADCPPGLRNVLLRCLSANVEERLAASDAAREFDICLQPRAQMLLYPVKTFWRSVVLDFPTLSMLVVIVSVNLLISGLNITFNSNQFLSHFGLTTDDIIWDIQLGVVNLLAYFSGIFLLLRLSKPVFNAVVSNPPPASRERMAWLRHRAMKLGNYFVVVCISLWLATGIILPVWLYLVAPRHDADLIYPLALFLLSQALFGVAASTLTFFIVTFFVVRFFFPRLLSRDLAEPHEVVQLVTVRNRMWIYSALAYSVPVGAVLVLMTFTQERALAFWLGAVGFIGSLLTFWLDRIIREDLAALSHVVSPAGLTLASDKSVSDSFMTGSKR